MGEGRGSRSENERATGNQEEQEQQRELGACGKEVGILSKDFGKATRPSCETYVPIAREGEPEGERER